MIIRQDTGQSNPTLTLTLIAASPSSVPRTLELWGDRRRRRRRSEAKRPPVNQCLESTCHCCCSLVPVACALSTRFVFLEAQASYSGEKVPNA
ncbi:hypothetical protein BJX65DRAFT_245197 [Aspergillus insuetus]